MKESIERRVILNETNEEVFVRFSQYVYTGDYDEAKPTEREVTVPTHGRRSLNRDATSKPAGFTPHKKAVSFFSETPDVEKKKLLWDKFEALYPLPTPAPSPSLGSSAYYDYTDVFLSHARMYVFADYYGIDALQILALQKLRRALASFSVCLESRGDIIQLIQYCFEQTVDNGGQADRLRSLICLYTACKVEDLWEDTKFRDLTKTLPDFPAGLITPMLERLD